MYEWYSVEYIGLAHGLMGVYYTLLHFPEVTEPAEQRAKLKDSTDTSLTVLTLV